MKKKVSIFIFTLLAIAIILSSSFVLSQNNESNESETEVSSNNNLDQSKVDLGYQCLEDTVRGKCDDLTSIESKIFTLLALRTDSTIRSECAAAINPSLECWPEGNCNVKTTAQAVWALSRAGFNTEKAENWLLNQKGIPTNLIWYLQIDTSEPSTCTITYDGSSYSTSINEEKKFTSGAGSCLTPSSEGYWLQISSSCYDREFSVRCDRGFLTTLIYTKQGSSTLFVSEQVSEGSAEETKVEQVDSLCFQQGNSCTYEGSLWATNVLASRSRDVNSFIPYLTANVDENRRFIPESFLYDLTGETDFFTKLLARQKGDFWQESDDSFYDTAVAILSLNDGQVERENAKDWLLRTQDDNGCWRDNVRNTAFILYSAWPKSTLFNDDIDPDCEASGNFCTSSFACAESTGDTLSGFSCPSTKVCCTVPEIVSTCSEQGGYECTGGTICPSATGNLLSSSDSNYCCSVQCQEPVEQELTQCEQAGGGCFSFCNSNEEESSLSCGLSGDVCCMQSSNPNNGGSSWWIWLLIILIILVILGIIYRNKVRTYILRMKGSKGGSKNNLNNNKGFPPRAPPIRPLPQRRVLPPTNSRRPLPVKNAPKKKDSDIEDVLAKLRNMKN